MRLGPYDTWLFDCDGVLLDSNAVKTEAFHEVGRAYGDRAAEELVRYHTGHGGVSRMVKLRHLLENIVGVDDVDAKLQEALERFALLVREKLLLCPEVRGVRAFLEALPEGSRRYVVSGGAQEELRGVLSARGLAVHFDEIYGSPATKEEITGSLLERDAGRCVFFGDSRYDFEVASRFGIDFVFVTAHTELEGWAEYFSGRGIVIVEDFQQLVPATRGGR